MWDSTFNLVFLQFLFPMSYQSHKEACQQLCGNILNGYGGSSYWRNINSNYQRKYNNNGINGRFWPYRDFDDPNIPVVTVSDGTFPHNPDPYITYPDTRYPPMPPPPSPPRRPCMSYLCPAGGNPGYGNNGQSHGSQGPSSGCSSLLCPRY